VPWVQPEDVSNAVVYLASHSSRFITGTESAATRADRSHEGITPRAGRKGAPVIQPLDALVQLFKFDRFVQFGAGVTVLRPGFLNSDRALAYFTLAVFIAIGLVVTTIRMPTTGLVLAALRSTEVGARASGANVVGMKIAISALWAAIAGIGGGCYALYAGVALPESFDVFLGLVWFAVLVTNGTRSNNAALAGGLFFVFLPDIFATYLPKSWGPLPTLLFGVGAVLLARNPEGVITMNGRQLTNLGRRLRNAIAPRHPAVAVPANGGPVAPDSSVAALKDVR
jgi:branched-chain amino acid transport system permease protein